MNLEVDFVFPEGEVPPPIARVQVVRSKPLECLWQIL